MATCEKADIVAAGLLGITELMAAKAFGGGEPRAHRGA